MAAHAALNLVTPLSEWRRSAVARLPHGVGRPGAIDQTSGKPVTTFVQPGELYQANAELDRDHDGIACEAA